MTKLPASFNIEHDKFDNTYGVVKWLGSDTMRVRCSFAPPYRNLESAECHLLVMEILEAIEAKQESDTIGQSYMSPLLSLREHLVEIRDSWK